MIDGHGVGVCKGCGVVIRSCRCMGPHKKIPIGYCTKCGGNYMGAPAASTRSPKIPDNCPGGGRKDSGISRPKAEQSPLPPKPLYDGSDIFRLNEIAKRYPQWESSERWRKLQPLIDWAIEFPIPVTSPLPPVQPQADARPMKLHAIVSEDFHSGPWLEVGGDNGTILDIRHKHLDEIEEIAYRINSFERPAEGSAE